MERQLNQTYSARSGEIAVTRNRVLRNTYWLLAISMVPTIFGAWLGVKMNFSFLQGSPFIGFMIFMAIAFGFFYAIEKNKNSGLGVALLLGFTFFMGLVGLVIFFVVYWKRR